MREKQTRDVSQWDSYTRISPTRFSAQWSHRAVPAVVSPVRFNAAALGTLVHHLTRFELEAFDELFGSVPFGHSSLEKKELRSNVL